LFYRTKLVRGAKGLPAPRTAQALPQTLVTSCPGLWSRWTVFAAVTW